MANSDSSPAKSTSLEEEGSNDEFKKFLATLPSVKGIAYKLYQFHGFWYASQHLQGVLNCRSHFQALDSDILLVTYPKSGTTWMKALLFTLINRSVKDLHRLTTDSPHDLIRFLEMGFYNGSNELPDLSTITSRPRLFATHMPASTLPNTVWDSRCKIVCMCRDPRDIFISLWHFANKLRDTKDGDLPVEEVLEIFCKGTNGFGPFWDHVLGYWKHSVEMPSRVLLIKYEDMKGNTYSCLRQLAEFVGLPFSEDEEKKRVVDRIVELCDFNHLSNLEVNRNGIHKDTGIEKKSFFRRGQVGDSLKYLTPEMSLKLDNLVKDKFHAHDFNFY